MDVLCSSVVFSRRSTTGGPRTLAEANVIRWPMDSICRGCNPDCYHTATSDKDARGEDRYSQLTGQLEVTLKKRSFSLSGHRTSVALEEEFWAIIDAEATRAGQSLAAYVSRIDLARGERPLASALRLAA